MRGFERRLRWGRRSRNIRPALLGLLLLLIVLASALHFSPAISDPPAKAASDPKDATAGSGILKIASIQPALIATVNTTMLSGGPVSYTLLSNEGDDTLRRVRVVGDGRVLGVLPQLAPKERRTLALSGEAGRVTVTAIDSSGGDVIGEVKHKTSLAAQPPQETAEHPSEIRLRAKSSPPPNARADLSLEIAGEDDGNASSGEAPLDLRITTSRPEGYAGEVVEYRCAARNSAKEILTYLELRCGDRKIAVDFLTPGREMYIEGSFVLHNHTKLSAQVRGSDPRGGVWTNHTEMEVWMVTPELRLEARASPERIHRGGKVSLSVSAENRGNLSLVDVAISDSLGEIGSIPLLKPGESRRLQRETRLEQSLEDRVCAKGRDADGGDVYASTEVELEVLRSSLDLAAEPTEAVVYKGQPVEATWVVNNTGEEVLQNVSLSGEGMNRCRLKEILPGSSVKMKALYRQERTARINLTARGYDPGGYLVQDAEMLLVRVISPGISLSVMPAEATGGAGERINISCLITNKGDDDLTDVVLYQQEEALASIEHLAPGEFQVVRPGFVLSSNRTFEFKAEGRDSLGRVLSDSATARAVLVTSAIHISAKAEPSSVSFGEKARITCIVENPGSIPLYNVFVISKIFGPLGTIDLILPRETRTISMEKPVTMEISDSIEALGFTLAKQSVRDACSLKIKVGRGIAPAGSVVLKPSFEGTTHAKPPAKLREERSATKASQNVSQNQTGSTSPRNSSTVSNSKMMDGISALICYIQKMLEQMGNKTRVYYEENVSASPKVEAKASRNYELTIESVKDSRHGSITILDVSAAPPQPAAWAPVKISVHAKGEAGIKSAAVKWGLSSLPLTKEDMLEVERSYSTPMILNAGDSKDGYWSCTIPGKPAGTYLVLSISLTDGVSTAEDGPYMLHWSTVRPARSESRSSAISKDGLLFIESSTVRGRGEVSIKDTFQDSAMEYTEKLKGYGSISLESERCMDKNSPMVNFSQQRDLVFQDGQLKGFKRLDSPVFHGGMGASITERFNLTHIDRSETDMIRSINRSENTLAFSTDQAFNGTWNIRTQYSQFFKKIKADQEYTGSFQTQKKIKFED